MREHFGECSAKLSTHNFSVLNYSAPMADLKLDTPRAERLRWTGRAVLIAGLAVVTLPSSQARGPDKSLLEAVQHYKRGIKSYEKGKVKEALPEFQEAVARANDQAYWHVMLSIALRKDGQDGPATEQCRVASQLAPDDEVL